MIIFQSYYIISIDYDYLPRPLVKVVAALCRAFTFLTGQKLLACYKLLCPSGECRLQDCNASLYINNLSAYHCRAGLNGLSGLPAKVINLK